MAKTDNRPTVSVIIPTFNRDEMLVHTLASVREQTFPDWEALVVDDGSSDATGDLVRQLSASDPRIRLLQRTREPKGAGTCRNIGLTGSGGDFVVFLDSDDLLGPTCLENRLKAMREHPDASFAVFPSLLFRQALDDTMLLWNVDSDEPDLRRFLRSDSVWAMNGPIWRKQFISGLGGCDEELTCWQDVDLHVRSLLRRPQYVRRLDHAPDCFVRKHLSESISQNGLRGRDSVRSMVRVFEKGCRGTREIRRAANQNGAMSQALLATFMHILDISLADGLCDLSRSVVGVARRNRLITIRNWFLWRYALAVHDTRLGGALRAPSLRRKLTAGLHLPTTIGTERYVPG
jgi:hypothetical protein